MRVPIVIAALLVSQCTMMRPGVERVPAVIYHMEGSQEAYGIEETHDGRYYIISGWTSEGGYHPPRCMLLKVDREGNLVEKRVHESLEWSCDAIIKSGESKYLMRSNHYIVFIDDDLNILSRAYIPNSTPNFVVDILEEGDFYTTVRFTTRKAYVFQMGDNLEILDSFSYQLSYTGSSVIEGSGDGGVYIAVQESDTSEGRQGYRVIRLNGELDSVSSNFIDVGGLFGYSAGYVKAMERFGDGTIAIAGTVVRGFLDGFGVIFRVDTNGRLISYRTVDYAMTTFMDMVKLRSGDIVVAGSALREGVFFTFVMRLRPDLSRVWYKEYLGDFDCYIGFGSIIQDSDGNLVLAGYCAGLDDIAFMKLDPYTGEPLVWSRR